MARLASRSRLTSLAAALVVAYAAALAAYLLSLLAPVHSAELGTIDWRYLYRGPVGDKPQQIAIVTVEEDADLPYWAPVPRAHLAAVVEALSASDARLIGLDFFLGRRSADARGDSLLRRALGDAGNVIVASFLDRQADGGLGERLPDGYFLDRAMDYGYATFFTDTAIESVREGRVAAGVGGAHALSLAGCLYAHWQDLDTGRLRWLEWSKRHAQLPGADVDYRRLIDYNGPPFQVYRSLDHEMAGGMVVVSSHNLLTMPRQLAQRFFADRIVLVGSGLPDAPDLYRTPFFARQYGYSRTFGVEIHAQFLHTLMSPRQLERAGFLASALLLLLPGLLAGMLAVRWRPHWALPCAAAVILVVWALGFHLFDARGVVIPLITPALATGLACILGLAYVGSTDGRQKNEARDRFSGMVGPEQLQSLLQQPDAWHTDGEERVVSVLWLRLPAVDVGRLSSREAVACFHEAWGVLSPLVHKHEGAVFHYGPDGLAAVFGAPLPAKDHASQAAVAAIDLTEAWLLRPTYLVGEACPGVGVATGRAYLGELAGGERYAYRVLGETVDRARDLATTAQDVGAIHVARETWELVREVVAAQAGSGDWYRVTGRSSAPPVGTAGGRPNPLWKYLKIDRRGRDAVSAELLGRLAVFADFNPRELRQLVPLLFRRSYRPQERVFAQGEVGSAMYVIERGSIDILRERDDGRPPQLLQRLTRGDFFGELALLSDVRRSAAAVAYEPTEVLVLFQSHLYDLVEREPELGVRLIRSLSRIIGERLVRTNEELVRAVSAAPPRAGQ